MIIFLSGKISDPDPVRLNENRTVMLVEADRIGRANPRAVVLVPAVLPLGMEHGQYMHICRAMIDVCCCVVQLPGWQQSKGAVMEAEYAGALGKPIVALREVLG